VFTSLHDALHWGKFDVAVVMVPHHLHETCAVQCLAAGKHVLLEKPLAHTLDSCSRLLEAAKCSNRVFMVGENSQHWPEVELRTVILTCKVPIVVCTLHVSISLSCMYFQLVE